MEQADDEASENLAALKRAIARLEVESYLLEREARRRNGIAPRLGYRQRSSLDL